MIKRFRFATLIALCLLAVCVSRGIAGEKDKRLDIYWADVEGGAATLIVTAAGESILVDSGNPGQRDASRITQIATQLAGLQRIDHLITTHYHSDHFGGAVMLATLIPIRNLYDNGTFEGQPNFPDKPYLELKCENRIVINPGDRFELKQTAGSPEVSLTCIGTRQSFIAASQDAAANGDVCATNKPKDRDGSDNANSVVLVLGFGDFRFYDGGDLTWNQEEKLVCPVNLVGKIDVYQVTHHGLDVSNNPVVLKTLQPTVAMMNNGKTKGCMPEVFATLKSSPGMKAIYQLHRNERPDGVANNVEPEYIANRDQETGNYMKLSVDPSSKKYTITIPSTKHEKSYSTK